MSHKYNTFGKRFWAGFIDGLVFLPITILCNRFENSDNKTLYIIISLLYTISWTAYIVIAHGKYGQTIGKHLMGIKVFDVQEQDVIGFKRAFLREAVWVFVEIFGVAYLIFAPYNSSVKDLKDTSFDGYLDLTVSLWFVLELITMFFNAKGRALHDFIAGSVVIDLDEMKREDLQMRHEELLASIQNK